MPRNMSFMLTVEQVRNQTKTVTRRQGWWFLKKGDILNAVEKGMGLKKGEKVEKICQIRVIDVRRSVIGYISGPDVKREGFPKMTWLEFTEFYCKHNKVNPWDECNRIEFEYVRECEVCGDHLTDDYFTMSSTVCYCCIPSEEKTIEDVAKFWLE